MVGQWVFVDTLGSPGGVGVYMANTAKGNPRDLVNAFRKVAKELGCNQSEQRFQEVLVDTSRQKSLQSAQSHPERSRLNANRMDAPAMPTQYPSFDDHSKTARSTSVMGPPPTCTQW